MEHNILKKCLKLINKCEMPIIGLGTANGFDDDCRNAVRSAVEGGYRAIDTAFYYGNEDAIGQELNSLFSEGKVTREQMFITTKLPLFANRSEEVSKYLKSSLKGLQLDYVDLYLIHHPFGLKEDHRKDSEGEAQYDNNTDHMSLWRAMEEQVEAGRTRAIGLSNFNQKQIDNIMKISTIQPSMLQIEMHAYLQQDSLLEFCKRRNIAVCAYSPLSAPNTIEGSNMKMLEDPVVISIARRLNRTVGQVLLRFLIEKGVCIIPKSVNPDRIKTNSQLDFALTAEDVQLLNGLDRGCEARVYHFRTAMKGSEIHKEYPFIDEI